MTPIPTFESFGAWLKKRRKQLDLTQDQLGALSGCSGAAIRKIEADERKPSRELAELLAHALQIPDEEQDQFIKLARGLQPRDQFTSKLESLVKESYSQPLENLPSPLTSLVDRVNDVAAVAKLISDPEIRWVTLIGPPGIGKTRLSIQSGRQVLTQFTDGVWFVDLSPLATRSLVLPAIVRTLSPLGILPTASVEQLTTAIKDRSLLLVLDNFEHVVDAAIDVVTLLKSCPRVKLLATSRTPVHVYGEYEYRVPSLSIPPENSASDPDSLLKFESVQLFVTRVRQHTREFQITAENADLIIGICTTLEGIPLALELAAASIRHMTLEEMNAILHHLQGESWIRQFGAPLRDLPARQHTIENVVSWSYTLLSTHLQDLFSRLGILSGWFDLDSVYEILFVGSQISQLQVRDMLNELTDQSLLEHSIVEDIPCWRMLEIIHEYALLQLNPEIHKNLSTRFANYFFEKLGDDDWANKNSIKIYADNLHAALKYFISMNQAEKGFKMADNLSFLWSSLGYWREGIDLLTQLFTLPDNSAPDIRAQRLQAASDLAWQVHEFEASLLFTHAAGELGKTYKLTRIEIQYLNRLGRIYIERGNYPKSRQVLEECLDLASINPSVMNPGIPLTQIGELALFENQNEGAQFALLRALDLLKESEGIFIAMATVDLAEIALAESDFSKAIYWLKNAYPYVNLHIRRLIIFLCAAVGYLVLKPDRKQKDLVSALNLLGAIEILSIKSGVQLADYFMKLLQNRTQIIRQEIGTQDWAKHYQSGMEWSRPQVLSKVSTFLSMQNNK